MNHDLQPGDRVKLPSGAIGEIVESPFDFPLHYLVQLPDGRRHILRRLLKPV